MPSFNGFVNKGYEPIEEEFLRTVADFPTSGSSISIWRDGEEVVNLWGGLKSPNRNEPWSQETISVIFSCTKGLMSLLVADLYQSGLLEYEDKVSKYWPEYAKFGKEETTVRELVSHRAAVPFFKEGLTLDEALNWTTVVARIENESAMWQPGEHYAYHAITHGWLLGELIRRVAKKTPREFFAEKFAGPLSVNSWLGLPPELENRTAEMYARQELVEFFKELQAENTNAGNFLIESLTLGSVFPMTLVGEGIGFNSPAVHQAEIPGAGAISDASGLAKIWSSVIVETDGVRFLTDKTVEHVTKTQSEGKPFTDLDPPYSKFGMGFQLDSQARGYLSPHSFGHDGAGGQCAFADAKFKIGFAYLTNEMGGGKTEDVRATRLINALRKILQK